MDRVHLSCRCGLGSTISCRWPRSTPSTLLHRDRKAAQIGVRHQADLVAG
ncbi:hypothetical protein chiPu_0030921, partial [Chiloscyllium punctatum]|nr:hypothetical protein [Chiloscyllium punctatum]